MNTNIFMCINNGLFTGTDKVQWQCFRFYFPFMAPVDALFGAN